MGVGWQEWSIPSTIHHPPKYLFNFLLSLALEYKPRVMLGIIFALTDKTVPKYKLLF